MKKLNTILAFMALSMCAMNAQSGSASKAAKPAAETETPKVEVADLKAKAGLFGVTQNGKDWYLDIPDSIMGRRILTVTRYASNTVGAGKYGGEMISQHMVYFEKGLNDAILLRADVLNITADEDDAIYKAVKISSENPIVASFTPEKGTKNRIKVTSFFEDDNSLFSFSASGKRQYNLGAVKRDASFISSIRTYPINTEVTVTKTYAYNQPTGTSAGTRLPAGSEAGVVTMQINTSFLLLPEKPMQPRLVDPRVGFFADGYTKFSDLQQGTEAYNFICRWRLEARPEDVEKQKRGELVEPVKPIVYYIDPATPPQWRQYLIDGVNDWQVAFEAAGWKNAIHAEMFPDDPDMSMEDARFAVIRYLASDIANAYGPNVHDPRSGEIIESHIGWYHNVMTLVHDWYQIQAGAVDPRARSMKYSDELMGDLIRFVSSHEVGHTLGLRHNMGSSAQTPVEKLRDKAWVEANGHTVSIMDYARFNYVAQPEDGITKAGLYPRIGDYDKWAIEFGYRPTYIEDVKEDHLYWNKVIIAKLAENPRLWFGGEGRDGDPRAQTEDLGDNSAKASEYGILNLQRVVAAIPEWDAEEADTYKNAKRMYEAVISQFNRYSGHVMRNIGGHYITYKSVEQDGAVYGPVPKERQVEALAYLNKNVFNKPSWLLDAPYITKIADGSDSYAKSIVNSVISASGVLEMAKFNRLAQFADQSSANYSPEQYASDLTSMIFSELYSGKKVDSYRRYVQKRYVATAIEVIKAQANVLTDGRALLIAEMAKVAEKAAKAKSSDAATSAHWKAISMQINDGLNLK